MEFCKTVHIFFLQSFQFTLREKKTSKITDQTYSIEDQNWNQDQEIIIKTIVDISKKREMFIKTKKFIRINSIRKLDLKI